MRTYLLLLPTILVFTCCSSPKYTDHFDHQDYNSRKKNTRLAAEIPSGSDNVDKTPLTLDDRTYTASADKNIIAIAEKDNSKSGVKLSADSIRILSTDEVARNNKVLSKIQRKEFRKAMREDMRRYVIPSKKSK